MVSASAAAGGGHHNPDRERFAAAAIAGATNRGGAEVVEPDGQSNMVFGRGDAVGGIEADPPGAFDPCLRPRMSGALVDVFGAKKVTADVACGDAQMTGGGDEDMG